MCEELLIAPALEGRPTAWFSPTYKMLAEVWRDVKTITAPITKAVSVQEHRIELITGGIIDMWSLDTPDSTRGRKYARVIMDEAAMVHDLENAWQAVIRPTLTDLKGDMFMPSTPKGRNFFWRAFIMGQSEDYPDWASWQMPTSDNPYIDPEEIEAARLQLPDRVFRQEYLAEFIEDSGGVFRMVAEAVDVGRIANIEPTAGQQYYLGVDLARVEDFTVLAVLDNTGRQVYFERFNEISWERQIATIERVANKYQAHVLLDSTGVGDPIFEALRGKGISVEGYQFTNQSKERLINGLALSLENSELRLMDIPTQTNELMAYQYELTPSRNVRMNAPAGMHDDTVIALGLAAWARGNNCPVEILTGTKKREASGWLEQSKRSRTN